MSKKGRSTDILLSSHPFFSCKQLLKGVVRALAFMYGSSTNHNIIYKY